MAYKKILSQNNGRFLFQYDGKRKLVRIKRGKSTYIIDLTEYEDDEEEHLYHHPTDFAPQPS